MAPRRYAEPAEHGWFQDPWWGADGFNPPAVFHALDAREGNDDVLEFRDGRTVTLTDWCGPFERVQRRLADAELRHVRNLSPTGDYADGGDRP